MTNVTEMQYKTALLKATLDSSIDGILVVDHETRKVSEYNQQFLKLWCVSEAIAAEKDDDKLLGFVISQLANPNKFLKLVEYLYNNPEENSRDVLEFKDGKIFERYSAPLKIDGRITGRVWFFRDNTEKTKNENLLKNIVNLLPSLAAYVGRDYKYQYLNLAYESWFGIKVKDYIGKPLSELLGEEALRSIQPHIDRVMQGDQVEFEMKVPYKNTERSVHIHYVPDFNEDKEVIGFFSVVRDVTRDKKNAEELARHQAMLFSASRLTALGEMAGGIAHEINNPLVIISTSTMVMNQIISNEVIDVSELQSMISQIDSTVHRIADIINGMKLLSRQAKTDEFMETSFFEILNSVLSVANEKFKSRGIKTINGMSKADMEVKFLANQGQLTQVLLNLLNNSYDAILNLQDKWIQIQSFVDPQSITITVTDSGLRIPPDVREKMFDPFFTTKEIGKGTGIGLSISKSIIKRHMGDFFYDENSPHTSFVIRLPRA